MIRYIDSSIESFKRIEFHEGLNVLISDRQPDANEKKTRNSAGKTCLVEIIHFLLGAECRKESMFRSKDLINHSFVGEFEFWGKIFLVERKGLQATKIYILNEIENSFDLPFSFEKNTGRVYLTQGRFVRKF